MELNDLEKAYKINNITFNLQNYYFKGQERTFKLKYCIFDLHNLRTSIKLN